MLYDRYLLWQDGTESSADESEGKCQVTIPGIYLEIDWVCNGRRIERSGIGYVPVEHGEWIWRQGELDESKETFENLRQ